MGSGPEGLRVEVAKSRLALVGPNELPEPRKPGVAYSIYLQVTNLFNVLLIVAAALSFLLGVALKDPSSLQMGFVILGVVAFNIAFSVAQERRAEKVVEALRRLIPANAKVTRGGHSLLVPVRELVPGDMISLEDGDRVPADARVLSAFGLSVDESILSGETSPRECSAEAGPGPDPREPTECPNLVLAGTTVASGAGSALVLATGPETVFGRIVTTTREIAPEPSPLQRELSRTGKINMAAAVVVGVVLLFTAFALRNLPTVDGLFFMIAVIIDLVPEGLQITVTLALAIASLQMARRNVVVKRLASVETLGSATVICSDKTGTITTGQMTVRKVWLDGVFLDVTGTGFDPEGRILLGSHRVTGGDREDLKILCEIAALDNAATLTPPVDRKGQRWTAIGDTTDAALLAFALKGGVSRKEALAASPRVGFVPFDSSRKMMSSVHRDAQGAAVAYVKGAAQSILERSTKQMAGGHTRAMDDARRAEVSGEVDRLAADAFRVLALAYRRLEAEPSAYTSATIERDLTFVGLVAIYDPPRPDVTEAVLAARGAGIKVIMITGDHELTAAAIAKRVGIVTEPNPTVIEGARLAAMSDDQLAEALGHKEVVFARTNPEQKHRIVKALRARGEIVAVTGDGVNDVPALTEADIGIAMGITGTDVAREAADMVLLDDNFATLVKGVELGRGVFDNLKAFLTYVFTHNWAELMSFLAFVFMGVPAAIGVVQVLAIDLVMEIPMSLALTSEPPDPAAMSRPPRDRAVRLFDLRALLTSAYVGVPAGLAGMLIGFAIWARAGWTIGAPAVSDPVVYAEGVAAVVAGIMLGQVGNLFARRSHRAPFWSLEVRRNRWLLPGLAGTVAILLAIVYVPFLGGVVSTGPLSLADWALVILVAPMVLALEEVRKAFARRFLPIPVIEVPTIAPSAAMEIGLLPEVPGATRRKAASQAPGAGAPVMLILQPGAPLSPALPLALNAASYLGSRLIAVRVLSPMGDDASEAQGEEIDRLAAEAAVPQELADLRIPKGPTYESELGDALRRIAERASAAYVVAAVERAAFSRKLPRWVESLVGLRVMLVSPPPDNVPSAPWPRRILVPVLRRFSTEPFDLATALTAGQVVPEVDVVAARVIRIPANVPMYSTYRAESLVDEKEELSFLSVLGRRPFFRAITPRLLLVRDVAKDIVDFAAERGTEVIIVHAGPRSRAGRALAKDEREMAQGARCAVVVLLTPD
jgi:magnesium-transporting ATPase (P-type)